MLAMAVNARAYRACWILRCALIVLCLGFAATAQPAGEEELIHTALRKLQQASPLSTLPIKPLKLMQQDVRGFRICAPLPPTNLTGASFCCFTGKPPVPLEPERPFAGKPLTLKPSGYGWQLLQEPCSLPDLRLPDSPALSEFRRTMEVSDVSNAETILFEEEPPGPLAFWWGMFPPTGRSRSEEWTSVEVEWESLLTIGGLDPDSIASIALALEINAQLLQLLIDVASLLQGVELDKVILELGSASERARARYDNVVNTLSLIAVEADEGLEQFSAIAFTVWGVLGMTTWILYRCYRVRKFNPKQLDEQRAPFIATLVSLFPTCRYGFCCQRRLQQSREANIERALFTGKRVSEWVHGLRLWVNADIVTSRIQWPALAAMVVGQQLSWQQFAIDAFFPGYWESPGFVRLVSLFAVGALQAWVCSFFLVGNNYLHQSGWLLMTGGAVIALALIIFRINVVDSIGLAYEIYFLYFHALWTVAITVMCVIRYVEVRRGVGGHVAQVDQACTHYVRTRLNENTNHVVRCNLCNAKLHENKPEELFRHWRKEHAYLGDMPYNWTTRVMQDVVDFNDVGISMIGVRSPYNVEHVPTSMAVSSFMTEKMTEPRLSKIANTRTLKSVGNRVAARFTATGRSFLGRMRKRRTSDEPHKERAVLPVFYPTLLFLSLLAPWSWITPQCFVHIGAVGRTLSSLDKILDLRKGCPTWRPVQNGGTWECKRLRSRSCKYRPWTCKSG